MAPEQKSATLNVLLAEDDTDDRFFFAKALKEIPITTELITVHDGEQLMIYLSGNPDQLPDVLFLDINMPRKNGFECISEIRENKEMKDFYVVMFSTFYSRYIDYEQDMIKKLRGIGVDDFIRKPHDHTQLKQIIQKVLIQAIEKRSVKKQQPLF